MGETSARPRPHFVLAALVLACGAGAACTLVPEDPARALYVSRRHFARAEVHFRVGRFDEAIREYAKAYEAKPLPGLLFNIGQCHRRARRYGEAIFFYERYLHDAPRAPNRALVKSLIGECRAMLTGGCGTDELSRRSLPRK